MKSVLIGITSLLFVTSVYAAPMSVQISKLSTLSFDGQILNFEYSTGGGCETHTTEVKVEVTETVEPKYNTKSYIAEVKVFDVTPNFDGCEAMLYMQGSVDLKQLVDQEMKTQGFSGYSVDLKLPQLEVRLY